MEMLPDSSLSLPPVGVIDWTKALIFSSTNVTKKSEEKVIRIVHDQENILFIQEIHGAMSLHSKLERRSSRPVALRTPTAFPFPPAAATEAVAARKPSLSFSVRRTDQVGTKADTSREFREPNNEQPQSTTPTD